MIARIQFASTPADRFAQRIAELAATIDQLPAETARAILVELDATRRQVLGELAGAQGYDTVRLRQLEGSIRDVMARFVARYQAVTGPVQGLLYDAGQALAGEPAVQAGLTFHVPQLARRPLEVAQAYQASLITGLADDAVGQISQALRIGQLRQESMLEIAQRVAGSLDSPATFGTIATRAEMITRTELGRIQAIATQAGLEETKKFVPDMQKSWEHSGNRSKWRRLGHIEAQDQVRDVADRFHVRPAPGFAYEDLLYPRDPKASARSTVGCGCLSIPYRAEWAGLLAA